MHAYCYCISPIFPFFINTFIFPKFYIAKRLLKENIWKLLLTYFAFQNIWYYRTWLRQIFTNFESQIFLIYFWKYFWVHADFLTTIFCKNIFHSYFIGKEILKNLKLFHHWKFMKNCFFYFSNKIYV